MDFHIRKKSVGTYAKFSTVNAVHCALKYVMTEYKTTNV